MPIIHARFGRSPGGSVLKKPAKPPEPTVFVNEQRIVDEGLTEMDSVRIILFCRSAKCAGVRKMIKRL